MTRRKAFIVVFTLFIVSVLFRLPNLNRPLSKHHEFIASTILVNIESWRQAGGGSKFHFIPLLSFQNPGDYYGTNMWTDSKGHEWYLSLGPGWFIIPYFIYQVLGLPAIPIYLQVINLCIELLSLVLLFYFLEKMIPAQTKNKYGIIIAACFLFLFAPGILWYMGNCYVHTGIMMPLVMLTLLMIVPMLESPEKIKTSSLLALSALIVLFSFIDWFILFICAVAGFFALWKMKSNGKYFRLFTTLLIASLLGVFLVFLQFASYGGIDAVLTYWKQRFSIRTAVNTEVSAIAMIGWLGIHLITSFLPLLLLVIAGWQWSRYKSLSTIFSEKEILFIKLYTCSLVLYNLVFLEWSYVHEFSILPWILLLAYIGARFSFTIMNQTKIYVAGFLILLFSLGQYYYINRPGKISRDGMPYDTFKIFGEQLRKLPLDCQIYSNLEKRAAMIEYYAGRNIYNIPSYEDAQKFMKERGYKKAVWIDQNDYRINKIVEIKVLDK